MVCSILFSPPGQGEIETLSWEDDDGRHTLAVGTKVSASERNPYVSTGTKGEVVGFRRRSPTAIIPSYVQIKWETGHSPVWCAPYHLTTRTTRGVRLASSGHVSKIRLADTCP